MANFLLSQTGEEVQEILNQAPETAQGLAEEVNNREQAVSQETEAREQAINDEVTARNEAIAAALAAALTDYYTKMQSDTMMGAEVTARNEAIASAIATTIVNYYTKQQIDLTLEDYATIAGVAATLTGYYTKSEVDTSIDDIQAQVTAIIEGTTPSKLAENLTSWDERGETPSNEEWTDTVRTTGGDMSIDSSRGAKLLSIIPKTAEFDATALKATGFNLLHDAVAVGSGYYFEVPALVYSLIHTAETNNGVLFTNQHGDNLRPVVYFKPLTEGVPVHANDGEVCTYVDAEGYRFYTCSEPGYIIVSNITFEETCAHIAWSRRYNEFIAPDAQGDAGSELPVGTLIESIHDYGRMLRAQKGEEVVYDELRAIQNNVSWYRRVERTQPEWTTEDNGDGTYTHTATISDMKSNGVAQCGALVLTINGKVVSYTDENSEATADYVLYQLDEEVSGVIEQSNDYQVEDWGLEILTNAIGEAIITTQYYQSLPDAIAALLSKVPQLRNDLSEETQRRIAADKDLQEQINTEKARAEGAEQTLDGKIAAEKTRAEGVEGTLQGNIDAESLARHQADSTLDGKIAAEKTRAEGAESTLQGNIDAEALARQQADSTLDGKIATEKSRAEGAEGTLQDNIDAEELARQQADTTLDGKIAAEKTRAEGAESALDGRVGDIEDLIPAQATEQNQLADKAFVNSSIASNTGNLQGNYNLVTDLGLTTDATDADIAAALATEIANPGNNDYCFVAIPVADATPTEIATTKRFKYNATQQVWLYEYSLNNSTFTAAQWDALNSGITALLVAKLNGLPNATALATQISTAITTALADYYTQNDIDAMIADYSTTQQMTTAISTAIATALASYYSKTDIDALIADYSTTQQMTTAISTAIATALASYYSKTDIDAMIADYSTTAQMSSAIATALLDYYTKTDIDALIADYSTTAQMTQAISTAIATALADYSTTSDMNTAISNALSSYYTKTQIDTLLAGYVQNGTFTNHTGNTTVHITAAERTAWNAKVSQTELKNAMDALTARDRLTDFDLAKLKQAVADQNLEKYGLKVGDQKTINGRTYVIAGLNPMKGTSTPYRLTQNHVGLIVIPHTTQAWNASGNTYTGADNRGAGYANSDLHHYLVNTLLPLAQNDLGAANLLKHSKLLTTDVNQTGYNRYGSATGCSSGWEWVTDQYISALSEVQVYGSIVWSSSGFDTGEACRQLDVFRHYNHTEIFGSEYPWLRDVVSASDAALAVGAGDAHRGPASYTACVAALILFN